MSIIKKGCTFSALGLIWYSMQETPKENIADPQNRLRTLTLIDESVYLTQNLARIESNR